MSDIVGDSIIMERVLNNVINNHIRYSQQYFLMNTESETQIFRLLNDQFQLR
jgi:hypothetical protein